MRVPWAIVNWFDTSHATNVPAKMGGPTFPARSSQTPGSVCMGIGEWLADLDSNQDKQLQRLLCYRYTIRQRSS